jgi:tRNA dimethylallyltransferase
MRQNILVITGPTATGKTEAGIECAAALNGEIVGADSRQVYRGLNIGTAKPSREQLAAVKHHFIDHVDPSETYTAGRYFAEAAACIRDIHARGKTAVVVGGTGLYVRALLDGIFESPENETRMEREKLLEELERLGPAALHEELARRDPEAAASVSPNNHPRLLRALEVCRVAGKPISALRRERTKAPEWSALVCGLILPRDLLYKRIDERTDRMLASGLVEETRALLEAGLRPECNALNTVGYKEAIRHLRGELDYEDMALLIRQHTRNYAKRQMTWFRKESRLRWYDSTAGALGAAAKILKDFREFQRPAAGTR